MPDFITCEKLTLDKLQLFGNFDCGDEPWSSAVCDWIRGMSRDCAELDIKKRRCRTFLYRNSAEQVIGFGAIGTTNGEWPRSEDPRLPVAIIPWLGIGRQFHGLPKGNDEIRYADQILADLVYKAKDTGRRYLVLFVDPRNARAIRLYERNGFEKSNKLLNEGEHMGMFLDLESVPNAKSGTEDPAGED
jgi:hypothetical protein